jgi:tetrapyrrole methylase family protein/MazG family protein
MQAARPRVVAAGLGPAGPELVPPQVLEAARGASSVLARTERHPALRALRGLRRVECLDSCYTQAATLDAAYRAIVERVIAAAIAAAEADAGAYVLYVVPGSPVVAERTVAMLRRDARVRTELVHAPSFLDLAWERLGIDPLVEGVRLVDAASFAEEAAGDRGPFLVAQLDAAELLAELEVVLGRWGSEGSDAPEPTVVVLKHLGLEDELVVERPASALVGWLEPDQLTSIYVPRLSAPLGHELMALHELVATLRTRCPWDREQTHGSLARHLLEEAHEALEAIDEVAGSEPDPPSAAIEHLKEELGDLLVQVHFHAVLAEERGRFDMADVARAVQEKLVRRHPHVFGDATARTPEEVATRWERIKREEEGRDTASGVPRSLPALAQAAKLMRKDRRLLHAGRPVSVLGPLGGSALEAAFLGRRVVGGDATETVGDLLLATAALAAARGVDPEQALRRRVRSLVAKATPREHREGRPQAPA